MEWWSQPIHNFQLFTTVHTYIWKLQKVSLLSRKNSSWIGTNVMIKQFILTLIKILKYDWLRQILYAATLCFLIKPIFLIYPSTWLTDYIILFSTLSTWLFTNFYITHNPQTALTDNVNKIFSDASPKMIF